MAFDGRGLFPVIVIKLVFLALFIDVMIRYHIFNHTGVSLRHRNFLSSAKHSTVLIRFLLRNKIDYCISVVLERTQINK